MCDQTNPVLRKRMIREVADESRKWVRAWLRRSTVAVGAATSAEACVVDLVLHRTRQESTISDSLDIRLLYRRHPAESGT